MKFLVLVICAEGTTIYDNLENAVRNTWGTLKDDRWEIFYLYSNPKIEKPYIDGDKFYAKTQENLKSIGHKMLQAFDFFFNNYEFDYIFRTNLSSYVDLPKLATILESKNFNYDGVVGKAAGIQFASGAGYVLSKNCVNYVINHKQYWNHSLIDDLALGRLMNDNKIFPSGELTRQTILRVSEKIDPNQYHYRCKQKNRLDDVHLINRIHETKYANLSS